jgi:hypothetical protein
MPKVKRNPDRTDHTRLHLLVIAAIAFLVYANSLSNGFVFDDEIVIRGDQSIRTLSSIPRYFVGGEGSPMVMGTYYRPLLSSSYALDFASGALRPLAYHLTNVLIHVANCLLLFWLLRMIFERSQSRFKSYATFIGAALFAVNPIHTEAVAWISGRSDSLCFTFFVLGFIGYLAYSRRRRSLFAVLTVVCYILSLFAKEMAITFPAVIILYDLIVNNARARAGFGRRVPVYSALVIVSLLYLVARWAALRDMPRENSFLYFHGKEASTVVYTMLQTIPVYFRLSLAPFGMLYHYGGALPYRTSFWNGAVVFAVVLLAALLSLAYYLRKRMPVVAFGLLFFFVTLLPVMNIVPTVNLMAERFLYIPSVFLSLVVGAVILKYCSARNVKTVLALSAVVLAGYGYMTIARNAAWKTDDSLYMSAAGRRGTLVYTNIGGIYARKGQYGVAERYFKKALDLRSDDMLANTDLAALFMAKGDADSAYHYAERAHTLHERSPEPMYVLAQLSIKEGNIPEAIRWLEKIQEKSPGFLDSGELLRRLKAAR